LFRILTLKQIYDAIEWPILVLLGALIPVGEGLRDVGATDLLATRLVGFSDFLPASGMLALVMVITMMVTPLLHHAAAVIVMGPIAATVARKLGLNIDPFLMVVALGASCDFLSPIGHQNNTFVMAPGGYRFSDYWRLGLPLSVIVVVAGVTLIEVVWPLR
jgi:di/tricarboxylate transporter